MSDVLSVQGLVAGYGDIKAIWDVGFTVAPGTMTAVLGRNGAGKSTTLRTVAGLNRVMAGSVRLGDLDISSETPYWRAGRGIALVPEGKRTFKNLTIEQNLFLGAHAQRLGRKELRTRADEAYARLPFLGERRKQAAGALSGGQQQLLAISQALMSRPTVLMLDEPSSGLAPALVQDVLALVGRLRDEQQLAVVVVEQSIDLMLEIADNVVVLELGRVAWRGTCQDPGAGDAVRAAYFAAS